VLAYSQLASTYLKLYELDVEARLQALERTLLEERR
jgi:hypothetical protein